MRKIIPLIILLLLIVQLSFAQEEEIDICVQNIEIAQQRYDEGRIQDIQELLNDCIKGGTYDKAQKSQALRLLTLAYIFLEDEKNSEATMLQLLETNHEFRVNPAIDPTEFINLHEQFRYKPLFNLGIRYITNFAQPIPIELNSSLNLTNTRHEYSYIYGFVGVGLNFEYEIFDRFILYPEIHFKIMSISRTDTQPGVITGQDYITIANLENQQWLSLPVSVKYNFEFQNLPKFKLYANLGGSIDYLLGSSRPADKSTLALPNDPKVGFTVNSSDDKNSINFGILAGGGATFKIGEGFFSLEARYVYSLTKLTNPGSILNPADPSQINTLVQDDIYRLNHIAFSIGYTANIYIPKQLR